MASAQPPNRRRSKPYQVNTTVATSATTPARNQPGRHGSIMFA